MEYSKITFKVAFAENEIRKHHKSQLRHALEVNILR